MRIAFTSYELPPITGIGGIGTYVQQASDMLSNAGHDVVVFAGGDEHRRTTRESGVEVIYSGSTYDAYLQALRRHVESEHQRCRFDIIECPEFMAESKLLVDMAERPAIIVKLHSPKFLVDRLNGFRTGVRTRIRNTWINAKKGRFNFNWMTRGYDYIEDPEWVAANAVDSLVSPSLSLASLVSREWNIPETRIAHLPNPFVPAQSFLELDPRDADTENVLFFGRLEGRKGVLELAKAIPYVLRKQPQAVFHFVGKPLPSPSPTMMMDEFLKLCLRDHLDNIRFTPQVPLDQIPTIIGQASVCVFPSRWENFPNVCLEAMSGARSVVASTSGGMPEQLDQGRCGVLANPASARELADGILKLLESKELRMQLGFSARERVLNTYSSEQLTPLYVETYKRIISARASRH